MLGIVRFYIVITILHTYTRLVSTKLAVVIDKVLTQNNPSQMVGGTSNSRA